MPNQRTTLGVPFPAEMYLEEDPVLRALFSRTPGILGSVQAGKEALGRGVEGIPAALARGQNTLRTTYGGPQNPATVALPPRGWDGDAFVNALPTSTYEAGGMVGKPFWLTAGALEGIGSAIGEDIENTKAKAASIGNVLGQFGRGFAGLPENEAVAPAGAGDSSAVEGLGGMPWQVPNESSLAPPPQDSSLVYGNPWAAGGGGGYGGGGGGYPAGGGLTAPQIPHVDPSQYPTTPSRGTLSTDVDAQYADLLAALQSNVPAAPEKTGTGGIILQALAGGLLGMAIGETPQAALAGGLMGVLSAKEKEAEEQSDYQKARREHGLSVGKVLSDKATTKAGREDKNIELMFLDKKDAAAREEEIYKANREVDIKNEQSAFELKKFQLQQAQEAARAARERGIESNLVFNEGNAYIVQKNKVNGQIRVTPAPELKAQGNLEKIALPGHGTKVGDFPPDLQAQIALASTFAAQYPEDFMDRYVKPEVVRALVEQGLVKPGKEERAMEIYTFLPPQQQKALMDQAERLGTLRAAADAGAEVRRK